jgi:UDPglucose--hexose-1-phosphate uridylyltransferase
MQAVEIRRDWFTGRVSVIAAARSKRPKLVQSPPSTPRKTCPFCRGNERMTPPAEMVAVSTPRGIKLKFGEDASNAHKWDVRVFPNMFPAVSSNTPPGNPSAYGHHLIVVETPDHAKDFDQQDIEQIETYLKVLFFEITRLDADRRVKCVSIFKNYGEDAGASIPHPHTQIIASRMVPPKVAAELRAFRSFGGGGSKSAMSVLAQQARNEGRLVLNKGGYVAFVPYAPMEPFELWVAPTKVSHSITEGPHVRQLADVLKTLLSAVKTIHGEVAYNLYFHLPPKRAERFHWHMEILPRTSKLAGYELGFGAYIITVPPEDAARLYRQALMT